MSAAFAYVGVGTLRERTPVYGRQLLIVCLALGAVLPLASTFLPALGVGSVIDSAAGVFFGAIIPGMAAYNYRALDAEHRPTDRPSAQVR